MNRLADAPLIVLATDSAVPSGVGEHMLTLARAIGDSHRVVLAFKTTDEAAVYLRRADAAGFYVKPIGREAAFSRWLKDIGAGILHVHAGIGWEGHGLANAGWIAGVPVVRTEHLPYLLTDDAQQAEHRLGVGMVERLVFVSQASARSYREAGYIGARVATVQNGIDVPRPQKSRETTRRMLGIGDGDFMVVTAARFTAQKNHGLLIEAARHVVQALPRVRFVLAGDGPESSAMQDRAADAHLGDAVMFLGERADVPDLLAAADLFVLSSRFEGLPLALLEAMALGLCVVATRIGGTCEALGDDTPWLVPSEDAASLGAAIVEALRDGDRRRSFGDRNRRRFEARFSADRMGHEMAALYGSVMSERVWRGMTGDSRVRIGFIGAGGIAERHVGVLRTMGDVRIAAFADTDFARAAALAETVGAKAYNSHRDMLSAEKLDALYICVPPFAHGEPEDAAIQAGLPIFVEKPLALDLATAEKIARRVEQQAIVTATGYHWRYLDTVEEARGLLADNPARLVSGYWLDQTPPPHWWWKESGSGGQIVEQATHIIDLARHLVGEIVEVYAQAGHLSRPDFPDLDVATSTAVTLRFASGAVGNLASTCLLRWGHGIGLHLFGDGLAIELSDREIMVDVGRGRPVRAAGDDPVFREDRDFIDAVLGPGNRIRCPYGEALKTHRVTLAIARSAALGRPIAVADMAQETPGV